MPAACPTSAELQQFCTGNLDEQSLSHVAAHIDTCSSCQQTLQTVAGDASDTILSALRNKQATSEFSAEPGCQNAVARAAAIADDRSRGTEVTIAPHATSVAVDEPALPMIREYKLLAKLGEGGMGAVYKALHTKLDKTVALKVLPANRMRDAGAVARFQREMKAVGRLEHPNIVRAMDAGEVDDTHFLVMEYVPGVDLSDLSRHIGPMQVGDACELVRQAAVGLQEAHEHGMVHRDIKPSNLILAQPRRRQEMPSVKILDLGLALLSEALSPDQQGLTTTGQMMGTLDYMAPEQGGDSHQVDIRADVYSLGATLYKLLCGEAPFGAAKYDSPVKKLVALGTQIPTPLVERRSDIPVELSDIVQKMLAKEPDERFGTPEEVADALAPYCADANLAAVLSEGGLETGSGTAPRSSDTRSLLKSGSVETGIKINPAPRPAPPHVKVPSAKTSQSAWNRLPPRVRQIIFAGMGCFAALFCGLVLFWQMPGGTVRIEINDPAIQAQFDGDGLTIKGADKEPIKLTIGKELSAGSHTLHIQRGDFEFDTKAFEIKKDGETRLKIELLDGIVKVTQNDGTVIGEKSLASAAKPLVTSTTPQVATSASAKPPVPSPSPASSTPADKDKPFALLREGKLYRELRSIAGVFGELKEGDFIEIHGNGPFTFNSPDGFGRALDIRAGQGYRPQIVFGAPRSNVRANMKFTGCDLNLSSGGNFAGPERLEFDNCRIHGLGIISYAAKVALKNSIFVLDRGFDFAMVQEILCENCLFQSPGSALLIGDCSNVKITLNRNTFFLEANRQGCLLEGREKASAVVEATGNVFRFRSQAEFFRIPNWRKRVQWKGVNNLYSGALFPVVNDKGELVRHANLDDWNALWKEPEVGSQFVEQVEPLFVHLTNASLQELRAAVEPAIQAARTRHQMPALGPEWDFIGPGEAYLAALAAEGRQPAELRPETHEGGPITLISGEQEVGSFLTIEAAAKAAQDQDIIEIRSDSALGNCELNSTKPRLLTLRGAPGYQATIQGLRNLGHDHLILENLTFQGIIFGNTWDPAKAQMGPHGGIHRLVNCQATKAGLQTRFVSHQGKPAEIINSRLLKVAAELSKQDALHIRNSVLLSVDLNAEFKRKPGEGGAVEFDRCLFWSVDPLSVWRSPFSITLAGISCNHSQPLAARNCYFAPPFDLVNPWDYAIAKFPYNWSGERNAFAVPGSFIHGLSTTFAQWQTRVVQEKDSVAEDPILFSPHFWKLMPGSPGSGAGPSGSDLGADISQVAGAITTPVSATKIEPPAPPAAQPSETVSKVPADRAQPFSLLREGKLYRELRTIAGVFGELKEGDIIEIQGNGPFIINLPEGFDKSLDIRAGAGFRPQLVFGEGRKTVRANMKFTGCDLDLYTGEFAIDAERLDFDNCRIHGTGIIAYAAKVSLKNSIFVFSLGFDFGNLQELLCENCLLQSPHMLFALGDCSNVKITLKRNTFFVEANSQGCLLIGRENASAVVEATGNVFHFWTQAEFFRIPNWRKQVQWKGANNLYSGSLFGVANDKGEYLRPANLDDWNAIWKEPEVGSQFVNQVEPLFVHLTTASLPELRAAAEPVVEAARTRHQMPDLGPDWDLIGPDQPYLKTRAAQGNQPAELRPETLEGGPITLLRDEKEVGSFLTIEAAAKAAQDQDVIEIRTDTALGNCDFNSKTPRLLTLRGAPGYQATIQYLQNGGHDHLNLENLTFQGGIRANEWDQVKGELVPHGGIHRLVNCQATNAGNLVQARFVSQQGKPAEIVNCRLLLVATEVIKTDALQVRNSTLLRLDLNGEFKGKPGEGGPVELDCCLLWSVEPHSTWRSSFGNTSAGVYYNHSQPVTARNCYFAPPIELLYAWDFQTAKFPYQWSGERNAFAVPGSFIASMGATFAQWPARVVQEKDSVAEQPVLFSPHFWKLMPGSPGSGEGPNGTDLGADLTRVAGANEASGENQNP